MYQPKTIYTQIALAAIMDHINLKFHDTPFDTVDSDEISEKRNGCFVSIHRSDGSLRGCIGTLESFEKSLKEEIMRNAVSAAFYDNRFDPLTENELNEIEISVDVLTVPEKIYTTGDLDPQIYGVIVSDNSGRRAVLLPSIHSIKTVDQQIDIVKRKAGLEKVKNEKLTFYRFTSNRYH